MKPESFDEQLSRFDLMCEGDPTFDLSDNDIAALLAVRTEMRIMARSTLASQERIKELEAKLAALDWTPITESNLPKVGDEVYAATTSNVFYPDSCGTVYAPEREDDLRPFLGWVGSPAFPSFTHFRPINPPVQP